MKFVPIQKMMERVEKNGDTNHALFHELLYTGELIIKITAAALVASIEDDREKHRYNCLYTLVRADSIGTWITVIEKILHDLIPQYTSDELVEVRNAFTQRLQKGNWQYEAVDDLQIALSIIYPEAEKISRKASLCTWFRKFSELRNKTRGHGAITPATCDKVVPFIQNSISLLIDHNPMLHKPWVYLHRHLSGKYRVVPLGGDTSLFSSLTTAAAARKSKYIDGIYLWIEQPRHVALLYSDSDVADFFVPNGSFNERSFELHSLITDNRWKDDSQRYLAEPMDLPGSETEGDSELQPVENVFTNLPSVPDDYVERPRLEEEVLEKLKDERYPVITLVGRGGIGKTSLSLSMLHAITKTNRYDLIVWFSARDIDLMETGPRSVKPRILTKKDIAEEYLRLINDLIEDPRSASKNRDQSTSTMAKHMNNSPLGPTLYVFDNFETVHEPLNLYNWLNANIRLPNKVVITTRFREFKADWPIEVSGMESQEARELIEKMSSRLGIQNLINADKINDIIEETDGHPYVIKIILGEMANRRKSGRPREVVARRDDILEALFERTYDDLTPLARRIFLTLSGWRSLVPQLAIEAVLRWRNNSEGGNPEEAIDELVRMSLIEQRTVENDTVFLEVPTTAAMFGRKKIEISQYRELIKNDIQFLQVMGPSQRSSLGKGSFPLFQSLFSRIAMNVSEKSISIDEIRPMLEFIARDYPRAWLLFADLEKEVSNGSDTRREAECIRRFLEQRPQDVEAQHACERLVALYQREGDIIGSCNAFLRSAEISQPELDDVSRMVNYVNYNGSTLSSMDVGERRALLKPLADLMELHLQTASATDLSRLAWLYIRLSEVEQAFHIAQQGLEIEPGNEHCERLVRRLKRH